MTKSVVYLIPTVLQDDDDALRALPAYIIDAVKNCTVFYVENEKTARRFLKRIWKEMVIDDYQWHAIHKAEQDAVPSFISDIKEGKTIGIISEAGCPGVADPGQVLVDKAQELAAIVKPLVGPSSILLALMASGMNGQTFQFAGYLPIEPAARKKAIREMEEYSQRKKCTQIFIETPYRNNQLVTDVLATCKPGTKFCIAADLTASTEEITTKTVADWKKQPAPVIHKRPAIFLLYAGIY
ncbi:MAG TPA: SAM-dependent methyltransferase [Chitinophagaceae bacterium]|nr:SAM-dependent methyltransferase [Chitinophagaceae bacterium]